MLLIFDEAQTAFGRVGASCSASKLGVTPDIMTLSKIFGVGLAKAKRIRNVAIAHGIQIYVMAIGGCVLVDAKATSLAQTIPDEFRLGCWACQDRLTVDVAPGRRPRSQHDELRVPDLSGLSFSPDESLLGKSVAVYIA